VAAVPAFIEDRPGRSESVSSVSKIGDLAVSSGQSIPCSIHHLRLLVKPANRRATALQSLLGEVSQNRIAGVHGVRRFRNRTSPSSRSRQNNGAQRSPLAAHLIRISKQMIRSAENGSQPESGSDLLLPLPPGGFEEVLQSFLRSRCCEQLVAPALRPRFGLFVSSGAIFRPT
jgi:hypothetical protein